MADSSSIGSNQSGNILQEEDAHDGHPKQQCFLCQKLDCELKCQAVGCEAHFCCDNHYSSHITPTECIEKRTSADITLGTTDACASNDCINGSIHTANLSQLSTNPPSKEFERILPTTSMVSTQLSNSPESSVSCLPFKVVDSQKYGRHFVATRDIIPLELILVDPPGVVGPATKTRPVCLGCLKVIKQDVR